MNDESKRPGDAEIAQQIELSVCQLDWLSPLACISAKFLSQLNLLQITPSSLTELIESDPVLAVRIFSLLRQQGLTLPAEEFSIRQAIEQLSLRQIRDALLSAEPYPTSPRDNRAEFRKQLTLPTRHIVPGCCTISPNSPSTKRCRKVLHVSSKMRIRKIALSAKSNVGTSAPTMPYSANVWQKNGA